MDFSQLKNRSPGKRAWYLYQAVVAACLALTSAFAFAADIYVYPSRSTGVHATVAKSISAKLRSSLPVDNTVHILYPGQEAILNASAGKDDFVIAIGTRAYANVLESSISAGILATLVPRQTFDFLNEKYGTAKASVSAVYIEQSYRRSLDLAKIVFPGRTVGVLLGPRSTKLYADIQSAQRSGDQAIYLKIMRPKEKLIASLDQVLKKSQVLVAYSDPEVSNRNTAQHILLTSYRHGIPVIAYSRAYVKAGAMMAVFSTPEQYARQAVEILIDGIKRGDKKLPGPSHPKYFSVELNENVARSLGIKLNSAQLIELRLRQMAGADE